MLGPHLRDIIHRLRRCFFQLRPTEGVIHIRPQDCGGAMELVKTRDAGLKPQRRLPAKKFRGVTFAEGHRDVYEVLLGPECVHLRPPFGRIHRQLPVAVLQI